MTFLKFPGRKRVAGVASACRRSQHPLEVYMGTGIAPGTDKSGPAPSRPNRSEAASKLLAASATCSETVVGYQPASPGARAESADLRGELAHHITHVVGKLRVVCGSGAPQRLERHRQLDRLDHPCAGD